MKIIPLSEAKAQLSRFGQLCHEEAVVVTVNGRPSFQLAPLDEEHDLVDSLIKHNPAFREMLERRAHDRTVSLEEAERILAKRQAARRRKTRKRARG
ncbi:MAG TPA: hypothetical protein VIX59_05000 [Candidatus Binataceae bacterium]